MRPSLIESVSSILERYRGISRCWIINRQLRIKKVRAIPSESSLALNQGVTRSSKRNSSGKPEERDGRGTGCQEQLKFTVTGTINADNVILCDRVAHKFRVETGERSASVIGQRSVQGVLFRAPSHRTWNATFSLFRVYSVRRESVCAESYASQGFRIKGRTELDRDG